MENQASVEDLNQLLGETVTEVCQSLDKRIAVPFATALLGLTPNEAMSALLGYRTLPAEAMTLLTGNVAAKIGALQAKAQELMAKRRVETANRRAEGDMGSVLAHFHDQLTARGLPMDLHAALVAHPEPHRAMGALVLGNGPVPADVQAAYKRTGTLRPQVLHVARSSWEIAVRQQA